MFILRTDYKTRDSANYFCEVIPHAVNRFPDGTLGIGRVSEFCSEILWMYEGDDELFTLQCLKAHTTKKDVKLVLPYIPHARMDRTEDGEVFTLKTFCNIINSLNFSEVIVADPHSNVSTALIDRVKTLSIARNIDAALFAIKERDFSDKTYQEFLANKVFFFPDEGAMKRYSKMFPGQPYAYGNKDRDWATGKINGLKLENGELVKDKPVLIVDDICSRGGTFYFASKALAEAGAKDIYLYVTHCENTVYDGPMYKDSLVKRIFTTDSLIKTGDNDTLNKIEIVRSFERNFADGKIF